MFVREALSVVIMWPVALPTHTAVVQLRDGVDE